MIWSWELLTLLGVVALSVLRPFEHDELVHRKISLVLTQGEPSMPTLLEALAGVGVVVSPTEYERHVKQQRIHVTLHAQVPVAGSERMASLLESQPGLERVRVEPIS